MPPTDPSPIPPTPPSGPHAPAIYERNRQRIAAVEREIARNLDRVFRLPQPDQGHDE